MMTACSVSVGAVTVSSLDISWEEPRKFHVAGIADSGESGEKISFEVLNPEKSLGESEDGKNPTKDYFVKLYQTSTGENGEFAFDFDIENATDKSGEFTLRIKNASEESDVTEVKFNYYSNDKVTEKTGELSEYMGKTEKDDTAVDTLANILADGTKEVYFTDFPLYDSVVSNDALEDACECLSYMTPTDDGRQMMKNIRIAVAIAAVKNDILSLDVLFEEYAEDMNISESGEYALYNEYSSTYKEIFNKFFKKQNSETLRSNGYETSFKESVVLTELSKANGSGAVAEKLDDFKEYFDLTNYEASKYQDKICGKIAEAFETDSVKSIADVQTILDTSYSGSSSSGGSSGGSSSGGSSSGNTSGGSSWGNTGSNNSVGGTETVVNTQTKISFTDTDSCEWAKTEIEYLVKRGIISGYSNTIFAPDDNLTRAQVCKILCKMFSIKEETVGNTFTDIKDGEWYTGYVLGAYSAGIINGYSETLFGPEDYITRQDFVVMMMRALNKYNVSLRENETDKTAFADEDAISDYALDSVNRFKNAAVISGKENGAFDPLGNITRAEAAKIIYRVQSIYEGRE